MPPCSGAPVWGLASETGSAQGDGVGVVDAGYSGSDCTVTSIDVLACWPELSVAVAESTTVLPACAAVGVHENSYGPRAFVVVTDPSVNATERMPKSSLARTTGVRVSPTATVIGSAGSRNETVGALSVGVPGARTAGGTVERIVPSRRSARRGSPGIQAGDAWQP